LGLALEESIQEDKDQLEQQGGVSIVFEKNILPYVSNKIIDYRISPSEGFVILNEGPNSSCGSCSC
jgi:Fe-S cluster assembly iron-binding protein IscA